MNKLLIMFLSMGLIFSQALPMQEAGFKFKNDQQKESILSCDGYQFVAFIQNAEKNMKCPEMATTARECGFLCSHVPFLFIWSSQLFDRFASGNYSQETQDLKDILKLMLIIDIRAQVDAFGINKMKSTFGCSVDSAFIQEKTQYADQAATYLKRKLTQLWGDKIKEIYKKKIMPSYEVMLGEVKDLSKNWNEENLMNPVWVCCVKQQSGMFLNNWAAGWSGDRFGNWWNPEAKLVEHCKKYDYTSDRSTKTEEVLSALARHASWQEYFGNMLDLGNDGEEYDSDGGF